MIRAQLDAPDVVEIPQRRKTVPIDIRISLLNDGENDFIAHAESADDTCIWHVLDDEFREVQREAGRGRRVREGVGVDKGVHSYHTVRVCCGDGTHDTRTLVLDASKLRDGRSYTIRGEVYGHVAEARFIAIASAAPPRPRAKRSTAKKAKKAAKAKKK
jgi:hypothetical protein